MAGRQKLVLTLNDVKQLIKHIQQLPFKRKIEQRLLDILPGKKSMADFSEADWLLIKKCRYEKNAYLKQIAALAKIQSQPTPTKFERDILDLAKRSDIDAHFLMTSQSYSEKSAMLFLPGRMSRKRCSIFLLKGSR